MSIIGAPREGGNISEFSVQSIAYSLFNFSINLKFLQETNYYFEKQMIRVKLTHGNIY